jgi:hypothetical protein
MKALFRLALTLTVAVVACLAPVASAQLQDEGLLSGTWKSSDGGQTQLWYEVQKTDLRWGAYTTYYGVHTHADGARMELTATHWQDPAYQGLVTFTYVHGDADRGTGSWILSPDNSTLTGSWKSSLGNGKGTWTLFR